jgi:hypothetical protein
MKFVLAQSLFRGACSQKVSKSLKIKGDQVMLPKTGLSTVCPYSPLGVKDNLMLCRASNWFCRAGYVIAT